MTLSKLASASACGAGSAAASILSSLRVGAEFVPPAAVVHFRSAYRALPPTDRVSVLAEIGARTATSHDEEPARFFSTLLDARRGAEDVDGTSGMGFLIDVRADALEARRAHGEPIERVDAALRSLLSAWLHPGHLQIQRVTFRSSAALCERIVKYERVHPSRNMSDLRARLGSGRRCYALLHPSLPDVPLSMVHCALLDAIPSSLRDVHTRSSEDAPTNAAFWSISSTQDGLRGIDLGHALLKRAVGELRAEFSTLAAFHTLSPIPGFRAWLTRQRESAQSAESVASAAAAASSDVNARVRGDADLSVLGDALDVLQSQLGDVAGDAAGDALADITPSAREAALRLCSRYLLHAKSGRASSTAALDPVMNFHCRNGAAVERLNWAGDPSVRGVRQSGGIMVNYAYNLDELAENAESYARGSVCASDVLMDLADGGAE